MLIKAYSRMTEWRLWKLKVKSLLFVAFLFIITFALVKFVVNQGSGNVQFTYQKEGGMPGSLNVDIWEELCGEKMLSLTQFPLFPQGPSARLQTPNLRLYFRPQSENSGLRIFGFLSPFESGDYSFYLDTSETSELWLSLDSNPENSKLIANSTSGQEWKFDNNLNSVSLLAGKRYYLEILLKLEKYEWIFHHFELKWKSSSWREDDIREIPSNVFIANDKFKQVRTFDRNKNFVLPMHGKRQDPRFATEELQRRAEMYLLPFISEKDSKNLFPACDYNPSYLVKGPLKRYQSTWELQYSSIYPFDYSDVVCKAKNDFLSLGNDQLDKDIAEVVASQVWIQLEKQHPGKYSFVRTLNVEEKRDQRKGDRYLVELELKENSVGRPVRFSEYVYRPWGAQTLCTPVGVAWKKSAVVNILLTTGNNQGRWILHFLDNMARIYNRTKDANFNVVIVDFDSKDIDIDNALKKAAIPSYQYTNRKGDFSRALGLQKAAEMVRDPNSILFAMDLHLDIPYHFLDDVRKHSVQHKIAYCPLLVRLGCGATATEPFGFWEIYGLGLITLYKSDWDKIGGMNVKEFKEKWGGEDWEFVDRLLEAGMEVEMLKMLHFFHYFHSKKGMWNNINSHAKGDILSKYWYTY